MATRVLLVDDHEIVRQGLKLILEGAGLTVVGEAGDGQEGVRLARSLAPDIAVLDFVMPILNGLDAAREIQYASPKTRTILVTTMTDQEQLLAALRAGVRGLVLKTHSGKDLLRAIREVSQGGIHLEAQASQAVFEAYRSNTPVSPDPLTRRERQVLQLIAEGKRNKEIASLLCIAVKTAEAHRARIVQKLGIRATAGLVRYAIHRGLSQLSGDPRWPS